MSGLSTKRIDSASTHLVAPTPTALSDATEGQSASRRASRNVVRVSTLMSCQSSDGTRIRSQRPSRSPPPRSGPWTTAALHPSSSFTLSCAHRPTGPSIALFYGNDPAHNILPARALYGTTRKRRRRKRKRRSGEDERGQIEKMNKHMIYTPWYPWARPQRELPRSIGRGILV